MFHKFSASNILFFIGNALHMLLNVDSLNTDLSDSR